MCKPLEQDSTSLSFLIQAKEIVTSWRDSGNAGLTKETFLACTQSIGAMIEQTSNLHRQHRLQYILPGKFMSDPIEARFGWYRQASGGNFFMSVRQLMLTEKKIRILTLLQQRILFQAARFSSDSMSVETSHSDHNAAELIFLTNFRSITSTVWMNYRQQIPTLHISSVGTLVAVSAAGENAPNASIYC